MEAIEYFSWMDREDLRYEIFSEICVEGKVDICLSHKFNPPKLIGVNVCHGHHFDLNKLLPESDIKIVQECISKKERWASGYFINGYPEFGTPQDFNPQSKK